MNRYIIDATNYEKFPPSLRRKYPFKDGEHERDLDMIECEVPRDVYQELYDFISLRKGEDLGHEMPIGFDFPAPVGVSITNVGKYRREYT